MKEQTYVTTRWHCPVCGQQNVLIERGEGDYYIGPTFLCQQKECLAVFNMPNCRWALNGIPARRTPETDDLGRKIVILSPTADTP